MLISTAGILSSFIFCLLLTRNYLPISVNHNSTAFLKLPGVLNQATLASHQTDAPTACQGHYGLCLAAAVTYRSHGLVASLWPSAGLLVVPAGPSSALSLSEPLGWA